MRFYRKSRCSLQITAAATIAAAEVSHPLNFNSDYFGLAFVDCSWFWIGDSSQNNLIVATLLVLHLHC